MGMANRHRTILAVVAASGFGAGALLYAVLDRDAGHQIVTPTPTHGRQPPNSNVSQVPKRRVARVPTEPTGSVRRRPKEHAGNKGQKRRKPNRRSGEGTRKAEDAPAA